MACSCSGGSVAWRSSGASAACGGSVTVKVWLRSMAPLEVWPESHWPGFALREADVFKTYMAWWCM